MVIQSLSKEYVRVQVAATLNGSSVNPTSDVVEFAFPAPGTEPSSWSAGSWETDSTTTPPRYYARVLVGPGAVVLADGTYAVWIKVTDSPEVIVRQVGVVTVR